ncbi:hypothetical protein CR513_18991, partial [Mucuna pruriens]
MIVKISSPLSFRNQSTLVVLDRWMRCGASPIFKSTFMPCTHLNNYIHEEIALEFNQQMTQELRKKMRQQVRDELPRNSIA